MDLVSSEEAEQSLAGPDWNDVATASYRGSDDDNDIVPRSDDEQPSQTYDLTDLSEAHTHTHTHSELAQHARLTCTHTYVVTYTHTPAPNPHETVPGRAEDESASVASFGAFCFTDSDEGDCASRVPGAAAPEDKAHRGTERR